MAHIKELYNSLLKQGFSKKTIHSLNEEGLRKLSNLMVEQAREEVKTQKVKTTTIPSDTAKKERTNIPGGGDSTVSQTASGDIQITTIEGEMVENENGGAFKFCMSRCDTNTKVGKKKFEKCMRDAKKNLKESLKKEITRIVENNLSPKISKKELMAFMEQNETTTKPAVKPVVKPGKKDEPFHPGKVTPSHEPRPKADLEKEKERWMDMIFSIIKQGKNEK